MGVQEMTTSPESSDDSSTGKPVVGVSHCLLGKNVRYNGGHTMDKFIAHQLSQHFDFVPVCPEVAIGLGRPDRHCVWSKAEKRRGSGSRRQPVIRT